VNIPFFQLSFLWFNPIFARQSLSINLIKNAK
jgi:hypothetical protein